MVDSSRQDLAESLAVIVVDPEYTGFMRSGQPTSWEDHQAAFDNLVNDLQTKVFELAPSGMLPAHAELDRHYYQIGPASQGPSVEILHLVQDVNSAIQIGITYLELGIFATSLGRWWIKRTRRSDDYGPPEINIVFTAPLLRGMCVADVIERHGEQSVQEITSHSRQEHFGAPDHPTGMESYVISVTIENDERYFYVVTGRGQVTEHFKVEQNKVIPLELPIWLIDSKEGLSKEPLRPYQTMVHQETNT